MPPSLSEAAPSGEFGRVVERPGPRRPWFAVKDLLWLFYLYPFRLAAALMPTGLFLMFNRLVDPVCQRLTFLRKRAIRRHLEAAKRFHKIKQDLDQVTAGLITNNVRRATDDLILHKLAPRGLNCTRIQGLGYLKDALARARARFSSAGISTPTASPGATSSKSATRPCRCATEILPMQRWGGWAKGFSIIATSSIFTGSSGTRS